MNSTVIMTAEMKRMAWHFAKAISVDEYKCDNRDLATRFYKGILGEMAVCQLLFGDYKLADMSLGKRNNYNHPDLMHLGLNVGVKTTMEGNLPWVSVYNDYPQIICTIDKEKNTIKIQGIAFPDVIKNNLLNEHLLNKNKKLFDYRGNVIPFYNLNNLKEILNEY